MVKVQPFYSLYQASVNLVQSFAISVVDNWVWLSFYKVPPKGQGYVCFRLCLFINLFRTGLFDPSTN